MRSSEAAALQKTVRPQVAAKLEMARCARLARVHFHPSLGARRSGPALWNPNPFAEELLVRPKLCAFAESGLSEFSAFSFWQRAWQPQVLCWAERAGPGESRGPAWWPAVLLSTIERANRPVRSTAAERTSWAWQRVSFERALARASWASFAHSGLPWLRAAHSGRGFVPPCRLWRARHKAGSERRHRPERPTPGAIPWWKVVCRPQIVSKASSPLITKEMASWQYVLARV